MSSLCAATTFGRLSKTCHVTRQSRTRLTQKPMAESIINIFFIEPLQKESTKMNRFSDPNEHTKLNESKASRQSTNTPSIPANLMQNINIDNINDQSQVESLAIISKEVIVTSGPHKQAKVYRNVLVRLKQKKARQIMEQVQVDDQTSCAKCRATAGAPAICTRQAPMPLYHAHDRSLSIYEQLRQRGVDETEAACRQRIYLSLLDVIGSTEDNDCH